MLCSLSPCLHGMDRKAAGILTRVIDEVLAPKVVVEVGGPYLDRRSTKGHVLNASWDRCVKTHLACRYARRDGFPVHDLSLCIIPLAPMPLDRRDGRLLVSNAVAVGSRVLFCGDPSVEWDWSSLFGDVGYVKSVTRSRRVMRRLGREKNGPKGDFSVYESLKWAVGL